MLLVTTSCHASPHDERASQGAAEDGPRYWLKDTSLLDVGRRQQVAHLAGPTVVRLGPDGLVHAAGDGWRVEGYLPPEVLEKPTYGRGLLLYAQRTAELHTGSADGAVIGRVHPGAFLSVVPGLDPYATVGLPAASQMTYVERDALGPDEVPVSPPTPEPMTVAFRTLGDPVWVRASAGEMVSGWSPLPCRDIWWVPSAGEFAQWEDGVELRGSIEGGSGSRYMYLGAGPSEATPLCPAKAVSWVGRVLTIPGPAGGALTSVVSDLPDGFTPVTPTPDPLEVALHRSRAVFWVLQTPVPRCEGWRFHPAFSRDSAVTLGRLVRFRPVTPDSTADEVWYPVDFTPEHDGEPSSLHLDTLRVGDAVAYKCPCESTYRLLHAEGDEIHVTPRRLPEMPMAYDPGEAERWFLSEPACEKAAKDIAEVLARDPIRATRVGFHAVP